MTRRALAALVLGLILTSLFVHADFGRRLESEHFAIHYLAGTSDAAVPADYARLVQTSLEEAYAFYAANGFDLYESQIPVHIVQTEYGELGAEYNDAAAGALLPVIEIATPAVLEEALAWMNVEVPFEDLVASVCAHELFHVVQDVYAQAGIGDIAEDSFVEAHADAMAEFAVPEANDYIEAALELILAPDSVAFFHRTYDASIFWIHLVDQYGMEALRDVMAASAAYDGRHAVDHAFADRGRTFFDLWAEFAITFVTGALRDAALFEAANPSPDLDVGGSASSTASALPPPVYRTTWIGQTLDVAWVNTSNARQVWPFAPEDVEGSALRVAHAYGIDVLDFASGTDASMQLVFAGDDETTFFVAAAVQTDGTWRIEPIDRGVPALIEGPFDRVRVLVTRAEAGTGTYSFAVSSP